MKFPKILRRMLTAGLALAVAVGVAGCGGGNQSANNLNIATGGTAGTYYPIGGAMADIISKNVEGMTSSAQSTGASVANINMLKDGDVQLAIVQNDIAYYAVNGTNMFDKKVDGIQAIASLYPETCQFVTLESSDVRSIADLKGKKVAVGAAGSGVEANVRQILQAYGLTYDDIDEQFLSFAESAAALKDGAIDVACLTAGYPTSSVNDVANQKQIRLIPLTNDRVEQLISEYPFFTKTVIPAGTYKGVDEDIQTVSVMAVLVAGDKLSEDTGYAVTKALFENLDKLSAAHSAAKNIKKDTATSGLDFMQLNKGAEKFYKE